MSRRPERSDDAAFRLELFRQTHGGVLAGLEPAMLELLLRQQIAGQAMTYEATFPDARFDVVESDGVPIGRIVIAQDTEVIHLVDIAILADYRGRGCGTSLLRDLIGTAEEDRRPVRLSVDPGNTGARRLYERLGFVVTTAGDTSLTMERAPREP